MQQQQLQTEQTYHQPWETLLGLTGLQLLAWMARPTTLLQMVLPLAPHPLLQLLIVLPLEELARVTLLLLLVVGVMMVKTTVSRAVIPQRQGMRRKREMRSSRARKQTADRFWMVQQQCQQQQRLASRPSKPWLKQCSGEQKSLMVRLWLLLLTLQQQSQ